MKDNNAIDELFREVISPAEFSPSDKVWDSIEKNLDAKSPAGNAKKFNYKLVAGVAAISLLAVLIAYNYNSSKNKITTADNTSHKMAEVKESKDAAVTQAPIVNNSTSKVNTESKSANGTVNDSPKENVFKSYKSPDVKVYPDGSSEEIPGLNDRQEMVIKTKPVSTLSADKKDNSDDAILMLPYYSSQNEKQTTATTPSVKNEITEPVKQEPKESILFVPNAFTPNGDGLNDVFTPQTADNLKEYKLFVYDRSGTMVYYTDEIHKGWDGSSPNSGIEGTKEGVYMWRIEIKNSKGEKEHLMGYLNLIR